MLVVLPTEPWGWVRFIIGDRVLLALFELFLLVLCAIAFIKDARIRSDFKRGGEVATVRKTADPGLSTFFQTGTFIFVYTIILAADSWHRFKIFFLIIDTIILIHLTFRSQWFRTKILGILASFKTYTDHFS